MNTAIRSTATWALGLILGLAVTAQAQTPNPLEFTTRLTPSPGNWFSPDSNFGGIVFDFNTDPNRPVAFGLWQYFENGESKVVYFQADLEYSTREEIEDTGIIATMNSPTFVFVGRGDYDDPVPDSGTTQLTGRNIRIQFTSSRTGTFIDNPGQPDERTHPIVGTVRGLPLVAPIDYSGEWLFAGRFQRGSEIETPIAKLTLAPYSLGATVIVPAGTNPYVPVLPEVGARVYAVQCEALTGSSQLTCGRIGNFGAGCDPSGDPDFGGCENGEKPLLLWVNPSETGFMAQTSRGPTGTTVFYPSVLKQVQVYAGTDQISIRGLIPGFLQTPTTLSEGTLSRVPEGLLQ